MIKYKLITFLSILFIAFTVYYSFYVLTPNSINDENTPLSEFSTSRALKHIEYISKEPHYIGSDYHLKVRHYLLSELRKLGLEPEIQSRFSMRENVRNGAMVHNIMARIKGRGDGKAILLMAHYDSAPFSSLGASDNGVAIAVILECVRALLHEGTTHVNDIIILFSDAEEQGLVGADAFVRHHPWINDVFVVMNFEARGSGGPSLAMVETNQGNEMMIKVMARAALPFPVTNSLLYSVYKMLPNDTDLTVFREDADINGFNFAFMDDFYDYHCSTDNFERVDPRSVEHHGSYLVSMLEYLKNSNLEEMKAEKDLAFFNFPYFGIIYYPYSAGLLLIIGISILFLLFLIYAFYRRRISLKPILYSILSILLSMIAGILLGHYLWKILMLLNPHYQDMLHGYPYNGHYYTAIVIFLTAGITIWIINRMGRGASIQEFLFAAMFLWIVLAWPLTLILPGTSFMILPVFSIAAILMLELTGKFTTIYRPLLYALLSAPAILILAPFTDMFPIGLGMKALPVSAIISIFLVTLLYPVITYIPYKNRMHLYFFGLAIVFSVFAMYNAGFDSDKPLHNSLNFVYYPDQNSAYWETYNKVLDPWLIEQMGPDINDGSPLSVKMISKYNRQINFHSKAPLIEIPQSVINTSIDTLVGDERIIEFTIEPQRRLNYLELMVDGEIKFNSFEVNGEKLSENRLSFSGNRKRIIVIYITEIDEKPVFRFSVDSSTIPEFILFEASNDLFDNNELSVKIRPDDMISMPFVLNDLIINVKSIKWR